MKLADVVDAKRKETERDLWVTRADVPVWVDLLIRFAIALAVAYLGVLIGALVFRALS